MGDWLEICLWVTSRVASFGGSVSANSHAAISSGQVFRRNTISQRICYTRETFGHVPERLCSNFCCKSDRRSPKSCSSKMLAAMRSLLPDVKSLATLCTIFRVSGFGFLASDFGFRVSGFVFRFFWLRVSGSRFRVP